MAGILQAKKAGYALDMEGFWLNDKFRIRGVIYPFAMNSNQRSLQKRLITSNQRPEFFKT